MIDRVRILIVEDDAALASGIARILEGEGHAVDVMATGEHAVLGARQERFDLVILDIGLPGIDGFEVLRRLRAAGDRMPVLVLTARDALDDRVHGLDLGADDYMAKPFAMPELAARVRALVRRSQAQTGPKIVHGPLMLDTRGAPRPAERRAARSRGARMGGAGSAARARREDRLQGGDHPGGGQLGRGADAQRDRGLRLAPARQARPGRA